MEHARRLNSWKEIAAFLGVSVRTAQRWERTERLPARRHKHQVLSSVFADADEINMWWHSRPELQAEKAKPPAPARSTAVLPFSNLSRDETTEILSDGLTEELINALAQVQGVQVVARTSAFHFKGTTADVRDIGKQLGVQTILEGSLRRSGERLLVTAQLISVADGYHLWSARYDRRTGDLFDLQEEIARAIVEALRGRLAADQSTAHDGRNPRLYALYLEGRYHCNRRTRAGFLKGVECFEQVLAEEAGMAKAWAGLADCHAFLAPLAGVPPREAFQRAIAAARRALELDGSLPEAHCALGFVAAVKEYDWKRAEEHFRQALARAPDHANAHLWLGGHVLAPQGRLEEAAGHARRACELDPLSPPARSGLGGSLLMLRRPEEAAAACEETLRLDPEYPFALRFLGEAQILRETIDEAARTFEKIEAPVIGSGFLGYCHALRGRRAKAREILQNLTRMVDPSSSLQLAAVQLGLGERDSAFASLERACGERSMGVHWLKVEPFWDPLRTDSRFAAVLGKLRLGG